MVASIPPTGFPPLRDLNTLRPRPWSRQQLLLPLLGGPRPGSTTRSAGLRLRETERVRVTVFKLGVPWGPGDGNIPRDLPSENWTAFRGFGLPRFSASRRVGPGPLSAERPPPRQDRAPGGSPTAGRGLPHKLDGLRPGSPSGRSREGTCTAALSPHICPDPAAPF